MLYVSGTNVKLTRGDSAELCVDLKNLDGTPYTLTENDALVLTIKVDANVSEALLELEADENGSFTFIPSDTEDMAYGTYKYDIQLTTPQGEVYTVIPVSTFTILEEVTWTANAPE